MPEAKCRLVTSAMAALIVVVSASCTDDASPIRNAKLPTNPSAAPSRGKATRPNPWEHVVRGSAALQKLGARIPKVARAAGLEPTKLEALFLEDPSLEYNEVTGNLAYAESASGPPDLTPPDLSGYQGSLGLTGLTEEEVTHLESRPGSPNTVFLDMDGGTGSAPFWGLDSYTVAGLLGPDPQTTRDMKAAVWAMVADQFAAFDVNVSTFDRGWRFPRPNAAHIMLTNSTLGAPSGSAGIASFPGWNTASEPAAWVYTSRIGYDIFAIASVAGQEIAHLFSINHDGDNRNPESALNYYPGHGPWGPIMGNCQDRTICTWSVGEYDYANNQEDDYAILGSALGFAPDPEGSASAPLDVGAAPTALNGVISSRSDVDAVRLTTTGPFSVSLRPRAAFPMLDPLVEVRNSSGQVIARADPAGTAPLDLVVSAPAGTYTLSVDGRSYLDSRSTGYSDYSSIGGYRLLVANGTTGANTQPVIASLTASDTTLGTGTTVAFRALGIDLDGDTLSYAWDFGPSLPRLASGRSSENITFTAAGAYVVTATVTDGRGGTATAQTTLTVTTNRPPTAAPSASPSSAVVGQVVQFTSDRSFDPDGSPLTFRWSSSDGYNPGDVASFVHSFTDVGAYVVTLTVTDRSGTSATASATVTVSANRPPTAVITPSDPTGYVTPQPDGNVVVAGLFDASASSDIDNESLTFVWTIGSNTYYGPEPDIWDLTTGTYPVELRVYDSTDVPGVATATLTVKPNSAPTALVQVVGPVKYAPSTVMLSASTSTDEEGDALYFMWDFGDGTTAENVASPAHAYSQPGTYTVTLRVSDGHGGFDSTRYSLAIPANLAPVLAAVVPSTALQSVGAIFDASGSRDPEGEALRYQWSFGDGTSSTVARFSKTYTLPGLYSVSLKIIDPGGLVASRTYTVTVLKRAKASVAGAKLTTRAMRAVVTIVGYDGVKGAGVQVTGVFSGAVSGTVTGTTDSSGNVVFTSPTVTASGTATIKFVVTKVVYSKIYGWDNVLAGASVTV